MSQWFQLSFYDPFMVAGICAVLMFCSLRYGFHRGLKLTDGRPQGNGFIDEACLAILGLLLAFCFAAAYGKLDTRNEKVFNDANALRTLYSRCRLLPDKQRETLQPLIVDAVRERVALVSGQTTIEKARELDSRAQVREAEIVEIIGKLSRDETTKDLAPSLMDACIDVICSHEARLAAVVNHVPMPVIVLLVLVASTSTYLIGRAEAESGRLRRRTVTLVLIVSAIVHVTLDLEQPLGGFIRTNHAPMMRLAETMGIKT